MIQLIQECTDQGMRVGLHNESTGRVLYMGETRTTKLGRPSPRMRVLEESASRRHVARFRRATIRFNGGTVRGLPRTVREILE